MRQDANLLNSTELAAIENQLKVFEELIKGDDAHAIHAATENFNTATEAFAAKRLDKSVSAALAGKDITTLEI